MREPALDSLERRLEQAVAQIETKSLPPVWERRLHLRRGRWGQQRDDHIVVRGRHE